MTPRADRLRVHEVIRVVLCLVLATALAVLDGAPARAADPTPVSKDAVEEIVRDYLLRHPEVVVDALRAMEFRHREAAQQRSRDAIAVHERELLADPDAPSCSLRRHPRSGTCSRSPARSASSRLLPPRPKP